MAPRRTVKERVLLLTKLIFITCASIIVFVGINFAACNFVLPGSINKRNLEGNLKNTPQLDCTESERRGYETLLTILTTVIALKTRLDE